VGSSKSRVVLQAGGVSVGSLFKLLLNLKIVNLIIPENREKYTNLNRLNNLELLISNTQTRRMKGACS
jgi:hypothetical protein